ncbi:MAG: response regulator [bacterium]
MEYIYSQESPRILVVDDEKVIRDILSDFLSDEGFLVTTTEDGNQALEELESQPYDLVITDLMMPEIGGLELMEEIRKRNYNIITIIMTGFGTVETAISAMKHGAYDYMLKPFKVDEMLQVINRALEKRRLEQENVKLKEVMSLYNVSEAMTSSLSLDHILSMILETTKNELDADATSLILEEDENAEYNLPPEKKPGVRLYSEPADAPEYFGEIDYNTLFNWFSENPFLISNTPKLKRFFKSPPERKGLNSFLSVPLKVRDQILGAVNAYSFKKSYRFTEGQAKLLIILASRAAQAIENARLFENLQLTFRQTIQGLVGTLEAKDKYTSGHSRRVTELAVKIAHQLGLAPREVERIEWAGLLHDIGKIGIRLEALNKPEKITEQEHEMFKDHTVMGKQILESIHFLREIVPLVYHHHEWYDGSGYPEGIAGEDIPLGARILAVADSYDAMTSDRPYRKAMSRDESIKELKKFAGSQFDPRLVDIFIQVLQKPEEEQGKPPESKLPITGSAS